MHGTRYIFVFVVIFIRSLPEEDEEVPVGRFRRLLLSVFASTAWLAAS